MMEQATAATAIGITRGRDPERAPKTNGNGHHPNGNGNGHHANGNGNGHHPNGNGQVVDFDERALADASISGSTKAFEELYVHYFPKVRGFCLRKVGNADIAEDIAQEAFARAFQRIDSFGGPKHFGGWVGTIAANLCTDHFRRKRNTEVPLSDDSDRGPAYEMDPLRNLQREDTARLIRAALRKLEPRQQEALLLHEIKGMTCAAVGDRLGISEVAAESLLARARRRLRKELTREMDGRLVPADLFGFGGVALAPAVLRAFRSMRESVGRRAADFASAASHSAGRTTDLVAGMLPSTADGLKAVVVAVGATVAIGTANVAGSSNDDPLPDSTTAPASEVLEEIPLLPSTEEIRGLVGDAVTGGLSGEAVSVDAQVGLDEGSIDAEVPGPETTRHSTGIDWEINGDDEEEGDPSVRVVFRDDDEEEEEEEPLLDSDRLRDRLSR